MTGLALSWGGSGLVDLGCGWFVADVAGVDCEVPLFVVLQDG